MSQSELWRAESILLRSFQKWCNENTDPFLTMDYIQELEEDFDEREDNFKGKDYTPVFKAMEAEIRETKKDILDEDI